MPHQGDELKTTDPDPYTKERSEGLKAAVDDFSSGLAAWDGAGDPGQMMSKFFADMRRVAGSEPSRDASSASKEIVAAQKSGIGPSPVTMVVGVPGPWRGSEDLRLALQSSGAGYQSDRITEMGGPSSALVDLQAHDPRIEPAFRSAGAYSSLAKSDYKRIAKHRTCCYLVDDAGGRQEAAFAMVRLAGALLRAGGFGVKVESSGRAHTPQEWLAISDGDRPALIDAFVTWVGGDGDEYYSCGMHNLGLPDVMAPLEVEPGYAGHLLRSFCFFLLLDAPHLADGETFSVQEDEPSFRLNWQPSQFESGNLFHNPFGVWRLRHA